MITGVPIGKYLLQVPLSEDEKIAKKEIMYQNNLHIARQDEILKKAKEAYKDETTMQKAENTRLIQECRQGFVEAEVKAQEDIDYTTAEKVYYAAEGDNAGEEICRVALTRDEMRDLQIDFKPRRKTEEA